MTVVDKERWLQLRAERHARFGLVDHLLPVTSPPPKQAVADANPHGYVVTK